MEELLKAPACSRKKSLRRHLQQCESENGTLFVYNNETLIHYERRISGDFYINYNPHGGVSSHHVMPASEY